MADGMAYGYGAQSYTVRYQPVKAWRQKSGKCARCGKPAQRSTTFAHTISPFNCDPETGQPRTYDQVRERVNAEAKAWSERPVMHERCEREPADG